MLWEHINEIEGQWPSDLDHEIQTTVLLLTLLAIVFNRISVFGIRVEGCSCPSIFGLGFCCCCLFVFVLTVESWLFWNLTGIKLLEIQLPLSPKCWKQCWVPPCLALAYSQSFEVHSSSFPWLGEVVHVELCAVLNLSFLMFPHMEL